MNDKTTGPIVIELDEEDTLPSPATAPTVTEAPLDGAAMQTAAMLAARRPSALFRWFWRLLLAVILFFGGVAVWDGIVALLDRSGWLGTAGLTLTGAFVLVCVLILAREAAALARLGKVEKLQSDAEAALSSHEASEAAAVLIRLDSLYSNREDLRWARANLAERRGEVMDGDTMLALAEDTLLTPLDNQARREIESAARQVATVTALVPLAFADVLAALTANIRMIRRISEIYGGRSGTLGAWRLTRAVMTHLVATGAVAVGDDLLGSIGGGHLVSRISRRFGEGLVNGALTARVGVAAIEVCRPFPFINAERPRVSNLVRRALTGLFESGAKTESQN